MTPQSHLKILTTMTWNMDIPNNQNNNTNNNMTGSKDHGWNDDSGVGSIDPKVTTFTDTGNNVAMATAVTPAVAPI